MAMSFRFVETLFCFLFMLMPLVLLSGALPNELFRIAAPDDTSNTTNTLPQTNRTLQWKTSPDTRGTSSIVSTCVVTLGLCLWSVVHLNIPHQSWAKWQWFERCLWVGISISVPDFLLYLALEQNIMASQLSKAMSEILKIQEGSNTTLEVWNETRKILVSRWNSPFHYRHQRQLDQKTNYESVHHSKELRDWTLTHSFYTLMGGFALETDPNDKRYLPNNSRRVALTVEGLQLLANYAPEMIPRLPAFNGIMDKSKVNKFSKALVCMQVLWFCLQVIERYFRHLRISLLEVVVSARCISAMFVYALWWKKPFGVEEPTTRVVSGEKMNAIFSYMWMCSSASNWSQFPPGQLPEFNSVHFCQHMVSPRSFIRPTNLDSPIIGDLHANKDARFQLAHHPQNCQCAYFSIPTEPDILSVSEELWPKPKDAVVSLYLSQCLSTTGFGVRAQSSRFIIEDENPVFPVPWQYEQVIHLEEYDVNRWHLASLAITKYGLPLPRSRDANYITTEAPSSRGSHIALMYKNQILWRFAIISAMENAIYALDWDYQFTTDLATWAWRISVLLCLGPPFCILLHYLRILCFTSPQGNFRLGSFRIGVRASGAFEILFIVMICIFSTYYVCAKYILVAIAVDDVFYLPDNAYQVASWSSYLPHF